MAGTYIPLIKRTKWVDLSNEHKKLRETVESDLKEGCNKGNIQPIMLHRGLLVLVNQQHYTIYSITVGKC